MNISRTFDLLERLHSEFPKKDALVGKINGEWQYFSTEDYVNYANTLSYGLIALGYKKGDKIATVSNNRPEWNFMDMAMSQIGVVHVPIYPTISFEEYEHILSHSDARAVIISDKALYIKIKPIIERTASMEDVYSFDQLDGINNWRTIYELGKEKEDVYKEELVKIKASISSGDLLSIIYTSGTTGLSKGVMLSHNNILTNAIAASGRIDLTHEDKMLSFLPLCHVYERVVNYAYQYLGLSIYYAENLGTIADDLKRFKVNGFVTVPRVLEMIYDKIMTKGKDLDGIKRKLFFWAVDLGLKFDFKKVRTNAWYRFQLSIANKLIFSKWREAVGGNVKTIISGGTALQPRLARVFWAAGIPVQEGYGLTETSPVIAVNGNNESNNRIGTVGPILDGVTVKIAEDGEILVKGPNCMLGYYKSPEQTAEVIDKDGWLHTGDVGQLIDGEFLKITDRKKEIFKNSAGKYIAPQAIENKFKESELVDQIMVVGEDEKFASALISPNFNYLHFFATKHKIHYRDNIELVKNPEILKRFQEEVNELNKSLGQVEQIKRFRLVCEPWTNSTGELSPTLKLKRRVLYDKYEHILREIYQYNEGEELRAKRK
ncbi:MAG: long-chain fatty acid--CoA ligase [Bacteroidales bacterium]|nr:long-chain fatty acid--CoA ligase [Bacteroidales bacterium]